MSLKAYWAYEFECDTPIEEMLALVNTEVYGPLRNKR